MSRFNQAEKDKIFAPEARQRRNSRKRKQEDQHEHGFDRSARIQSVKIVEFVANHVAMAQRGDHSERAQVHERIDQQINQNTFNAVSTDFRGSSGDQSQQHVANMRDGRISQQAFRVGLRERGEVRASHGGDGNEDQEWNIDRTQRSQAENHHWIAGISSSKHAQKHRPSRSLHRHRHESCDTRRRSFISVRSPLMERHRRHFKQQAGNRGHQSNNRNRISRISGKALRQFAANGLQVRASGKPIN